MKKQTIKKKLLALVEGINRHGGVVTYYAACAIAYPLGGDWLLKMARRRDIISMDPDPHDGRASRTVAQKITRRLPGYMKNPRRSKKETVTSVRHGRNVTPTRVMLTDAGRVMLKKKIA